MPAHGPLQLSSGWAGPMSYSVRGGFCMDRKPIFFFFLEGITNPPPLKKTSKGINSKFQTATSRLVPLTATYLIGVGVCLQSLPMPGHLFDILVVVKPLNKIKGYTAREIIKRCLTTIHLHLLGQIHLLVAHISPAVAPSGPLRCPGPVCLHAGNGNIWRYEWVYAHP